MSLISTATVLLLYQQSYGNKPDPTYKPDLLNNKPYLRQPN